MIDVKSVGRSAFALASAVVLTSCGAPKPSHPAMAKYEQMRQIAESGNCTGEPLAPGAEAFAANDKYRAAGAIEGSEAEAFLANRTSVSYDFGRHGTQIEYTGADGTAHLWYPGNSRILHGRWKMDRSSAVTRICFAYEGGASNPQTGHSGEDFECGSFQHFQFFKVDSIEGDVFDLAKTNAVSTPLPKDAVAPYLPNCMPFKKPYLTNGKPPIEHLVEDLQTKS